MSRHLTILALVAVPGLVLSACDAPSTLSKAKPGECYSVVGRDSLGAPKLAKTACAGSPAALAAACPKPEAVAPSAACAVAGSKVATSGEQAASGRQTSFRHLTTRATTRRHVKVVRHARIGSSAHYASRDDGVARSGEVTSLGIEYARVGEELAGGYERRQSYDRYEAPPPPPPPALRHREASIEYSERSRQSRSYSESYSSSSSSSSSSRGAYGGAGCGCETGGRGVPPHSPFDGNGYLTWRGKTPG